MTTMNTKSLSDMTPAELKAEIERLSSDNAKLTAQAQAVANRPVTFKIAEKTGGISAYGLGRFPTTLHRSQWNKLLDNANQLRAFIEANKATLDAREEAYKAAKGLVTGSDSAKS